MLPYLHAVVNKQAVFCSTNYGVLRIEKEGEVDPVRKPHDYREQLLMYVTVPLKPELNTSASLSEMERHIRQTG
jgi:hypothetical protein